VGEFEVATGDVRRKQVLCRWHQGALHGRQHGSAEYEIDFDLDSGVGALNNQLDIVATSGCRHNGAMAHF
jgi:hypothetical protein